MDLGIKGKVALVTAASKGLGYACAEMLALEGCKVAICSSNKQNVEGAAAEIGQKSGSEVTPYLCDLSKKEDVENLLGSIKNKYKAVDILVMNVPPPRVANFEALTEEDWIFGFNSILLSSIRLTKGLLKPMRDKNWGRIVYITSVTVREPSTGILLSTVFRAGTTAFAKALSNDYGKDGVLFNTVCPGTFLTDRFEELVKFLNIEGKGKSRDEIEKEISLTNPLRKVGRVEQLASAVTFLCSEKASYITGQTLAVDGGKTKSLL